MTKKIYCDMCGEEIFEKLNNCEGDFESPEGLLVHISVTAPSRADICKTCVIKIITDGEVFSKHARPARTPKKNEKTN